MDAKPQRIRVRGDENAPFPLAANKALTQKNKSTPALSTMFQNGANKGAAKRAAFGDVSNTAKPIAGRDDISLAGKKQTKGAEKAALIVEKKASLAQPAQRPMSMAGMKGLLNNVPNAKPIEPSKQIALQQQTANARKILNKRATVFKDASEPSNNKCEITSKETNTELEEGDNKASLAQAPAAAKRTTTTEEPTHEEPKPVLEDAEEHSIVDSEVDETEKALLEVDDDHCKVQGHSEDPKPHELPAAPEVPEPNRVAKAHRDSASTSHAPAQSEPEDWDEEDEHEEEDGYITARSYRSRGENTTGGATTVLFPKFTQQVRRELALAEQVVEATRTEEDIEDEWYDTSMVAEYSEEIFEYMREQEIKMLPNAHYMDNQAEIQWSMRSVLMDWVVQVHYRFSLLPETLFLCVNYIDRFLSCKIVSLGKLQLVGATAIFIAAKYEEINCPSVQEIVYMVDGGYSMDEILKAERFMLSMLQFELGWPGPMSFLRRISKADDYDLETRTLAKYFLEITVMDERFVGSPASFVAAGAHCLARLMLRKGTWTPAHAHYAGYTYTQLLPLISLMVECCENPRKHHGSIYEKFSDKRYKRASLFVENEMRKGFIVPEQARDSSYSDRNASTEPAPYWKRA
ncbi:G2/mitotic-specific cyclin [Aspergillus costaricaensis CBS 115574]|uniref:G2/mitotic-specific cyclin n=1 Tax=Aspergillus costaricaensis CBS 115574 TaxID=1448317 RepID=A0ACD1HYU3_9EURO|nr:G2/mitotic-specific cyclin [Aspergillus costaricaensis CBS 115574]RAK83359.1 G2/mitotic-specific cyclin [Aspergillus costaricaensis CBS 115574]